MTDEPGHLEFHYKCGRHGGLHYADRVLDYWYPVMSRYTGGVGASISMGPAFSVSTRPAQVP